MRESIQVGSTTIKPGERAYGYLPVGVLAARTEVRIPFQVVNGASDGPRVCLESTLHGWEPMGAEIIRRAMLRIDPHGLRGAVYCLPLANPLSVEFGGTVESSGMRVNPADVLDLNRVWPGKRVNGWLTEQMAYVLWNEVITQCEYLIDMHDGTGACDELPVAFPHAFPSDSQPAVAGGIADGIGAVGGTEGLTHEKMAEMNRQIREMAIAFGSSVIWWREHPANPAMLSGQAMLNGIVPLVVEAGGAGIIDDTIDQGAECLLNILKHLEMIAGDPVLPKRQIMVENYVVYRSLAGGFYLQEPEIKLGAEVKKGQVLGRVLDPVTSEVMESCTAPINGIIISRRVRMPINPGGYIAHIADTDAVIWERSNR
ncbi:MAG: succinylglutamate desuccinylase/aspartoacylase family protein [Ardenticatenaceae bacterium]|nr:succinylglutamate desuccinylase/aspartoacylase family protein [Ardenticatenaceae bacterium]